MGRPKRSAEAEAAKRQALVEAARNLMVSASPTKLPSVRALADQAGMSPASIYLHYADLNELFLDVIELLQNDLGEFIRARTETAKDHSDRLYQSTLAYVEWGLANQGAYQLLFEDTDREEALKYGRRPGAERIKELAVLISKAKGNRLPDLAGALEMAFFLHGLVSLRMHKTGVRWPISPQRQVKLYLKNRS